ncbi:ribosome hibernation factor-recruiting GTPase MRF [Nocardia blacklockiae]|uniref:ribosome hibernation factor-recruiting GTPase MRF n=1 Tax=Nocardia blacklockiae TaxID=480036 RepID=UPI0018930799|nr:GTP-binding protein [Nocardia blacklockiae]MBF6172667.1 GTP-binding protein [Nocardia blacklockiae]
MKIIVERGPVPSHPDRRTPVVLLAGFEGLAATGVDHLARMLRDTPGTVVVRHDLRELHEGIVRRTVSYLPAEAHDIIEQSTVHELAHGCVSCTLRADLLPLLCQLAARDSVQRIVIALDPAFEAEAVCQAIAHVPVAGVVGRVDGPAGRDVRLEAVVTCLDARTWLSDALSEETLVDRGLADADDDRTVAQLAVGQVEFADVAVLLGTDAVLDTDRARLGAVLDRLLPQAPRVWVNDPDAVTAERIEALLAEIPADSRRGRLFDAHAPLLRGQPPLDTDHGVTLIEFATDRPFHPARLHEALDVLFEGVVTARGRIWLATQPDEVVWLESAGGGLRVGAAGRWLAAMSSRELAEADPDRRALAALRWDEQSGDRDVSLVILACDADADEIRRALHWALVDDAELLLVHGAPELVAQWEDPFGQWHADPCEDGTGSDSTSSASPAGEQRATER